MAQKELLTPFQQSQLHQRLMAQEPTAFAEICEQALPMLTAFLQTQFPQQEAHLCDSTAVDTLLAYYGRPHQYNPEKLPLFAYLRMAARRDMLNAIDKQQRRARRLTDLADTAVSPNLVAETGLSPDAALDDWLAAFTPKSRAEVQKEVANLLDGQEQQVLWLMLDGERQTERYAQVMGIDQLDKAVQQKAVKQVKDRIKKRLRRLGQKLS